MTDFNEGDQKHTEGSTQENDPIEPESSGSIPYFTSWKTDPSTLYQHSNDEIVELFGNDYDKPDTNNATIIRYDLRFDKYEEADSYEKWKKLSFYNSGVSNLNYYNSPLMTYTLNEYLTMSLLSQMDIKETFHKEILNFVLGLDLGQYGHNAAETVCMAIVYMLRSNDHIPQDYYPNMKDSDKSVEKVVNELNISDHRVYSMLSKFNSKNTNKYKSSLTRRQQFEKQKDISYNTGVPQVDTDGTLDQSD